MPWGEIDDKAHGHWKFADAGKAATGVYWLSISWARDHLNQRGVIPEATARRTLGADEDDIAALTRVKLWEPIEGGWLIHDYRLRYEAEDAKRSEKARLAAETRWKAREDARSMLGASCPVPRAEEPMLGASSEHARAMPRARDTSTNTKGVSNETPPRRSRDKPATPHRFSDEADTLARDLWERLSPKPMSGFVGFRERVSEALGAGYTEPQLRAVAQTVGVWTRAGIELALKKARDAGELPVMPNGNGHHPPKPSPFRIPDDSAVVGSD